VRKEDNERLHGLLKEFDALTGVPVLLNTSFNVKGEPIVETPSDAIECFLTTGIDYLILHERVMTKNAFHRVLAPILGVYSDVRWIVQTGMSAD
jgi:carbamoyltransferase